MSDAPSPASEGVAKRRILVIDDNPDIHRDFEKILAPHRVSATGDAAKASANLDALESLMLGNASPKPAEAGAVDPVELSHAHQGEDGFNMIRDAARRGEPFVAAFVDMRMPPGWDGLRTIRAIREVDQDITLVVCTAYSDHSWEKISAEVGALDKLMVLKKPFDPIEVKSITQAACERQELLRRARMRNDELESLVRERTVELEEERAKDKERLGELEDAVQQRTAELRKLAMHDKLTGLPNRVMFYDRLLTAIEKSRADSRDAFAVLFLDFDRFKVINDSLGHLVGDQLLIGIAKRLDQTIASTINPTNASAVAARLGGDEFCILLQSRNVDTRATDLAQRLVEVLSAPYELQGHPVVSTASIGLTLSTFGYSNAEDVLRDADTAMYRAKLDGRGRYAIFDRTMHEQAMRRLVMENDIRVAAERGELQLFYQPIVSIVSGEITGAESLLRWRHPKRGLVSPADFIPLAEETGAIASIGAWVLKEACTQMARWRSTQGAVAALPYLSVNVSRKQLGDDRVFDAFQEAIDQSGVDPALITIEITESALVDDPDRAERTINRFRERGSRVVVDDFGTGQSSLSTLRRFQVDGIKLDRSFLDEEIATRRSAAVIHSVITLARDLNLELVAEGIESLNQLALLQTLGCEHAQGYLFSRPSDAMNFVEMLQSRPWGFTDSAPGSDSAAPRIAA